MEAFVLSFFIIFLAEMGDKSQLMSLAFATRYRATTVLVAITVATLLLNAGSVIVGATIAMALPTDLIQIGAGLVFLAFAAWTMRGDDPDADGPDDVRRSGGWAVLAIGSAFFLAEFGDKTMLAAMTLATTEEPIGVWLGSTFGMVAANAVAIAIGAAIGTRLPERWIRRFASAAFVVFGVVLIAQGIGLI
ncbi:MAG: TMEM165/GDT1 family protein [Candidatus Limnocylindrales bacterium]